MTCSFRVDTFDFTITITSYRITVVNIHFSTIILPLVGCPNTAHAMHNSSLTVWHETTEEEYITRDSMKLLVMTQTEIDLFDWNCEKNQRNISCLTNRRDHFDAYCEYFCDAFGIPFEVHKVDGICSLAVSRYKEVLGVDLENEN